jgi:hypothetical protein
VLIDFFFVDRQPGKLFTSWNSLKFAGFSVLGALSLVTAVLSLLYTTAAGALGTLCSSYLF